MLITKNAYGYSRDKKYVEGRGFVDWTRSLASYVSTNKDLIAKPLLSAVGNLGALGLTSGVPALINHIISKRKNKSSSQSPPIDNAKYKEILESLMSASQSSAASVAAAEAPTTPVSNIIGSGRKRGAGIKKY